MLSDAVSYPQSGNGWRPVLIGGFLKLFNWLLLPAFIVFGYYVQTLRGAALEEQAPRFEEFGDLLIDGLKSFVIFLGYIFVPLLLVAVVLFNAGSIIGENGGGVLFLLIVLIGVVFLFGTFYLFPVALTAFAITDDLGTAFEVRTIADSAFTGDYAVSVFLSMVFRGAVMFSMILFSYIIQLITGLVFLFGMIGLSGTNFEPSIGIGMVLAFLVGILFSLALAVVLSIVDFYTKVAMYYLLGRGSGSSLCDTLRVDRPTPASEAEDTPNQLEER